MSPVPEVQVCYPKEETVNFTIAFDGSDFPSILALLFLMKHTVTQGRRMASVMGTSAQRLQKARHTVDQAM